MTASAQLPLADTSDMIGLHRVFREALAAAPTLVGTVDDADRAELVCAYYANVLDLLRGHHEGEDELLTPLLVERVPDQAGTVTRIAEQHETVLAALAAADAAVAAWHAQPSAAHRDDAVRALRVLDAGLAPHLDEEEQVILPIAAQCIDVAEWGRLPEHGMRSYRGDRLWLILGLIQEQMTEEQKRAMESHMPPELREFWNGAGIGLFESFVAELRR